MRRTELTRRRFLAVTAAMTAISTWSADGRASTGLHEWRGVALGAQACIRLAHPDSAAAQDLLARCTAEIARLERIFSLYRPDSAVSRLNSAGVLESPPLELVDLLGRAAAASAASDGLFDVTVQPLWTLYTAHFAKSAGDPPGEAVEEMLGLVGWRGVSIDVDRVALARPGMAVTLNGIAQGYVTDRVADLLRAAGMEQVLIDLGETRAIGSHPLGRPWRAGLADPHDPDRIVRHLSLADQALATSGGYGTPFEPTGRYNHLIHPRSGRSAPALRSVSVTAPTATLADAASTALSMVPTEEIAPMLRRLGGTTAYVLEPEGSSRVIG